MNARQYGWLLVIVVVCLGLAGGMGLSLLLPSTLEEWRIDLNKGGISCIPDYMLSP